MCARANTTLFFVCRAGTDSLWKIPLITAVETILGSLEIGGQ